MELSHSFGLHNAENFFKIIKLINDLYLPFTEILMKT